MCIIVCKNQGVDLPPDAILKNCFENNSDGAGIMYVKNKKVVIEKGLMSYKAFDDTLSKIKKCIDVKNTSIVLHFRIGTQGSNSMYNTHPFPISSAVSELQKRHLLTDLGLAHNGIISKCSKSLDKKDADISDTMIFIRDYLYYFHNSNYHFYKDKSIQDFILKFSESKFAFLDNKGEIVKIGDFKKENGVYYSNSTYSYNFIKYDFSYVQKFEAIEHDKFLEPNFRQLMICSCCSSEAGDEFSDGEIAIDKNYNIFYYDYRTNTATYHYKSRIYDAKMQVIQFDPAFAESTTIIF